MAQPAPDLSPYDEDADETAGRPGLRSIEGGGETTEGRGSLRIVPKADEETTPKPEEADSRSKLRVLEGGGETTEGTGKLAAVGAGGLAAAEAGEGLGGLYKDGLPLKKRWSRRRKAGSAAAGGGVVGAMVSMMFLANIYHVPSLLGSLNNSEHSSFVVRHILEKRLQRMVNDYAIRKAAGTAAEEVKAGSLLEKVYKVFDKIDLLGKMKQDTGLEYTKKSDGVHMIHKGRDVGRVESYEDLKRLRKNDKLVDAAYVKLVSVTLPVFRRGLGSTVFRFIKYTFRKPHFGAPALDPKASDDANLAKLTEDSVESVTGNVVRLAPDVADCALNAGSSCDQFQQAQEDKPVDTTTVDPEGNLAPEGNISDPATSDVSQTVEAGYQDTLKEAPQIEKAGGSFVEKMVFNILSRIIGPAAAALATKLIPIVGWIDFASQLDNLISTALSNDLLLQTIVLMRQQAYGSVAALWLGYADQIKAGLLPDLFLATLNKRTAGGAGAAATALALGGKDSSQGVPVDPKVGSNFKDTFGGIVNAAYNGGWHAGLGIVIGPGPLLRAPLILWFHTVHGVINLVSGLGGDALGFILKYTGIEAGFNALMKGIFGDNWKERFGQWAVQLLMFLLALTIDPLARGAQLFNNIYTGLDVIFNQYCRSNLGCFAVSPLVFNQNDASSRAGYQQDVASIPLGDRLFSLNEPSSLINSVIANTQPTTNPIRFVGSIMGQSAKLPLRLMGVITGKPAYADGLVNLSAQDLAALDGQRQFGYPSEDALDVPTSQEVVDQADPVCPANSEATFNTCQADKETSTIALCFVADCPQNDDGTGSSDTGAPAGTGTTSFLQPTPSGLMGFLRQALGVAGGSL